MKSWRRSASIYGGGGGSSPPPPPPTAVTVLAVTFIGDGECTWQFSANVVSWTTLGGLQVQVSGVDELPTDASQLSSDTLVMTYPEDTSPGELWDLFASITDITFDPPGTLSNQSGVIS